VEGYRDSFGNWCSRLVAPAGRFTLGTDAIVRDPGVSDPVDLNALQHQVQHLPAETLLFLLGSRYCETDRLSDEAWRLFGHTPLGWPRVQAICDFVHNHITFGYEHSRAARTASEAYVERHGVCRDYAQARRASCRLPSWSEPSGSTKLLKSSTWKRWSRSSSAPRLRRIDVRNRSPGLRNALLSLAKGHLNPERDVNNGIDIAGIKIPDSRWRVISRTHPRHRARPAVPPFDARLPVRRAHW
jgi:Transglutaminase-like superfamily